MTNRGALLTATITVVFLFLYYSHLIVNADKLGYGVGGDGYKNYYTLTYYLENDCGTHFSGMNYPYGENVLFTDNQPAMAWLLKPIAATFPSFTKHIHGFISWSILGSIVLTAVVLYLILLQLSVEVWLAVCFSVLIAMLSPQLKRITGHFSLAYSFFIPVIIYLLIRFFKTNGAVKYILWLITFIAFFSFIHIYYLALAALFVSIVGFLSLLGGRINFQRIRFSISLLLSSIIPFLILKAFLFLTDTVSDRPSSPWGFLAYCSTVADIILHPSTFMGELVAKLFPSARIVYHYEGIGYVGFVTVLCLLATVICLLIYAFSKRYYLRKFAPFNYLLPAAFVVLLFAMAFPFKFDRLEKYHELLPSAVKQFRSVGRFSWVFYYTAAIFASVFITHVFGQIKTRKPLAAYFFIVVVGAVWFVDMNMISNRYKKEFTDNSTEIDEPAEKKQLLASLSKTGKKISDFQAIYPLPLFLNGSEKFLQLSSMAFHGMRTSLSTKLPLVCGQMSRTSLLQTFKLMQLASDDLLEKDVLKDYNDNRPLLMIYDGGELNSQGWRIFSRATFLFNANGIQFFELPLSAFTDSRGAIKRSVSEKRSQYYKHKNFESTDSINRILLLSFEQYPVPYSKFGKGAYCTRNLSPIIFFDSLPNGLANSPYEVTFWTYGGASADMFIDVFIYEIDGHGNYVARHNHCPKFDYDNYHEWARSQFYFSLQNPKHKILITAERGAHTFDEIMIKPVNENVLSHYKQSDNFMFNNFPIW